MKAAPTAPSDSHSWMGVVAIACYVALPLLLAIAGLGAK